MGIALQITDNGTTTVLQVPSQGSRVVTVSQTQKAVINTTATPVVVEVLKGQPGLQNVYVGTTPPANPDENMVWIDIS